MQTLKQLLARHGADIISGSIAGARHGYVLEPTTMLAHITRTFTTTNSDLVQLGPILGLVDAPATGWGVWADFIDVGIGQMVVPYEASRTPLQALALAEAAALALLEISWTAAISCLSGHARAEQTLELTRSAMSELATWDFKD